MSAGLDPIEAAILKTVLYADVFNFPLTLPELYHYLIIDHPVAFEQVSAVLSESQALAPLLQVIDGYVIYNNRRELIALRRAREAASAALWDRAVRCGVWLARLPFVRMVALTGALSMRNASGDHDDLDYVLVTAPGRVWLARGFAVLLVKLAKRRGVVICPNYVLATTALAQTRHTLYVAHEIAQMVPLYGLAIYAQMRAANPWVRAHLYNADHAYYQPPEQHLGGIWRVLKSGLERLLSGQIGRQLDQWEYKRKLRRFASALQQADGAAQLDSEQVKGHFRDHGRWVMQRYRERLRLHHLDDDEPLALAGD
jgi:hypothetical protein